MGVGAELMSVLEVNSVNHTFTGTFVSVEVYSTETKGPEVELRPSFSVKWSFAVSSFML